MLKNINIPFIKYRYFFIAISALLFVASVVVISTKGFNYGIDFEGGTQVNFKTPAPVALEDVRAAAGEVGAAIAERPTEEQAALASYGKMLGIAFQLVDDALDYSGDSAKLGKSVGDDFREGKITLPVILAYRRGSDEERAFWRRTIADGDITDADLDQAMSLIQSHNAIKATLERARHYGSMAKDALAIFRESKAKSALLDVVDFSTSRAN